ncbi:MAG: hypothetical protein ACQESV_07695 [Thermodesulfobacteriota bacterium]
MSLFRHPAKLYARLHRIWNHPRAQNWVSTGLIVAFIGGLIGIECNRQGLLPPQLAALTPDKHFYAINLAFTLVLTKEVIDLVFALPRSVSQAVGKQFEILALIFLRNSFKELSAFSEPIDLDRDLLPVLRIMADGVGALCIFVGVGWYYRLQRRHPATLSPANMHYFIDIKKTVALVLLGSFLGIAIHDGWRLLTGLPPYGFFKTFYTVLIFSDILLVLVSQKFLPSFKAVFRNSGYAVSTLLLRLALTAPAFYDVGIGVLAVAFAVGLTISYNRLGAAWDAPTAPIPLDTKNST